MPAFRNGHLRLVSGSVSDSADTHDDPPEASPLLNPRQTRETADYGSSGTTAENSVHDLLHTSDPEQEQHEAEYLNEVWRHTSDKLIDITQLTTTSNSTSTHDDPSTGTNTVNYERIFEDTFPRRPYSSGRPTIKSDTFTPPTSSSGDGKANGVMKERHENADLAAVHKIGKPLIINFDELVGEGPENERPVSAR